MLIDRLSQIEYPGSDGKRMADNTLQFRWIVTIEGGLEALFHNDPNVFVAGDLLWYPVEGLPEINAAPDAMVVFGRPKGDRKSYKQWEEDNIAPQVIFEILSDSNDFREMKEKEDFYEEHGVEEYYIYDPRKKKIWGWKREGALFRKIHQMNGWVSPLLNIRFAMEDDLIIYGPNGKRFLSHAESIQNADKESQRADALEKRMQALLALLAEKGINPNELPGG
jgi:Uma2 family endonuclease